MIGHHFGIIQEHFDGEFQKVRENINGIHDWKDRFELETGRHFNFVHERLDDMAIDLVGVKEEIIGVKGEVLSIKGEVVGVKEEVGGLKKEIIDVKDEVKGIKKEAGVIRKELIEYRKESTSFRVETKENFNKIFSILKKLAYSK